MNGARRSLSWAARRARAAGAARLDHMTRGASLAASSPLINLQVLVPIALGVAHGLLYPTRSLFAEPVLMAAAAAWAWIASRGHPSTRGLHEPST